MVMGDVGSFSQTIVFRRDFFLIVNDDPFPNLKITPTPFVLVFYIRTNAYKVYY